MWLQILLYNIVDNILKYVISRRNIPADTNKNQEQSLMPEGITKSVGGGFGQKK